MFYFPPRKMTILSLSSVLTGHIIGHVGDAAGTIVDASGILREF